MCWAKNCCGFVRLDLGCILIGIFSLILTTTISVACVVILAIDRNEDGLHTKGILSQFFDSLNIEYVRTSIIIVTVMLTVVAIFGILASVALILGIQKNKPCYIICYFSYGIAITIIVELSALLIILHNKWQASLCLFLAGMFNIHVLVVVHTVYEAMQRGKGFGSNPHETLDDECFIISDEES